MIHAKGYSILVRSMFFMLKLLDITFIIFKFNITGFNYLIIIALFFVLSNPLQQLNKLISPAFCPNKAVKLFIPYQESEV